MVFSGSTSLLNLSRQRAEPCNVYDSLVELLLWVNELASTGPITSCLILGLIGPLGHCVCSSVFRCICGVERTASSISARTHKSLYTGSSTAGRWRLALLLFPGSNAVEVNLRSLTLIHVCFQIRWQGSEQIGDIMCGNSKHWKRDPGTQQKQGEREAALPCLWEDEGRGRCLESWADTQ